MDRTELLLNGEIPVIILDNFYDGKELDSIWEELEFFTYSHKLLPGSQTGTAQNQDTEAPLKENSGLFLDVVWNNQRQLSNILTVNRKIFANQSEVIRQSSHWFFRHFSCTADHTLISYYEHGNYYKPHSDNSIITVLNWFCKEPKSFSGGDLKLHINGKVGEIEFVNNRTVIFPSCIPHEVTPLEMKSQYFNQKLGRYCMTQFLNMTFTH